MNTMKHFWNKALGLGALTWAVVFVVTWLSLWVGIFGATWTKIVLVIIAGAVSHYFATIAKNPTLLRAYQYSAIVFVINLIFGSFITSIVYPTVLDTWVYWASIIVVFIAPLIEFATIEVGKKAPTTLITD